MIDTMDNEDGKFCLDDMFIGFKEDHLNRENKVTLYQDDHIPLDETMDVAVKDTPVVTDSSPVVESIVIDNTFKSKKVNLDQCSANVMDVETNTLGLDTPLLKHGLGLVERKRKLGLALQSPHEQQQPTTPRLEKRRTITSQLLQLQLNDDYDVANEELENIDSRDHIKTNINYCLSGFKVKDGRPTPLFKLVWDPYGIVVDLQFCLAFLGLEEKKEVVHRQYEPAVDELSKWAAAKVKHRMLKCEKWTVKGIDKFRAYEVKDNKIVHIVELVKHQGSCLKWQLSGLPYGHVCVMSRCFGMTNYNKWAKGWFSKRTLKATYQEFVYPLPNQNVWVTPNDLQVVLPPALVKPQLGRPKKKDRIKSQGEDPIIIRCSRCDIMEHNRDACHSALPSQVGASQTMNWSQYHLHDM
nr:hypothetical protein [Tanacetum cinerariifolium]